MASPIWLPYEEYPWAAPLQMTLCGSLPGRVSANGVRGSAAPVTRIAWKTYERPESGSRIQPPRQVAAPPNGSISVGWLWVSFLNMRSHS